MLTIEDIVELGDDCLGLRVVVNTRDTTYIGVITYLLPSSRRMALEKVCDPKTGKRMMGLRHFFFQDIISVAVVNEDREARQRLLKDVYQEDQRGKQLLMRKLVPAHLASQFEETGCMDEDVLLGRVGQKPLPTRGHRMTGGGDNKERDEESLLPPPPPPPRVQRPEKWVVISSVDDAFRKALSVIRSENDVSVAMEGQKIGRSGTLAWLSIATSTIIFLFDMAQIGTSKAIQEGLGEILTDESILKVVHDCRAMEDMLHHQFDLNLCNVFDTQAAEVYLYMVNHRGSVPSFVSGLPSLLIRYLKLSPHHVFFSHVREECVQSDESVWFERPLPESLCEGLARGVMYLRELRLVFIKLMLVDLSQVTNLYLGSMRDKDSATASNIEPHVVPAEVQRLGRRCANNTVDVHDPYITYSRDAFKIMMHRK